MSRPFFVANILAISLGAGLTFPAVFELLQHGTLAGVGVAVLVLAVIFMVSGATALGCGLRKPGIPSLPAPVRAAIIGNILFLAFFALEFSDGLIRQGGRVLYWTSVLFLPSLFLLYGLVSARRWAWWTARGAAAIFTLWFVVFMAVVPFADLRGNDGPIPWWGRVYVAGATLIMASITGYTFRALGHPESKSYFGLLHTAKP